MRHLIFLSIASYRDPDLIKTVISAYNNAAFKDNIFFSIHSQAEEDEHPDLSFIPKKNIRYIKSHWSESLGVCWAREIANKDTNCAEYFFQIDSHSRFIKDWDRIAIEMHQRATNFWNCEIILTTYPWPFTIDKETGEDVPYLNESGVKIEPQWLHESKMLNGKGVGTVQDLIYGDESFYIAAGCIFTKTSTIEKIPYDPNIYFIGEEPSLTVRAYTRGIKIICPPKTFIYVKYGAENRRLHWEDHNYEKWSALNIEAYKRLEKIMTGSKEFGVYGIDSEKLFNQYQNKIGIDLRSQDYKIW